MIGGSGFLGRRLTQLLGPRGVSTFRSRPIARGLAFDATTQRLSELLPRLPDLSHVFVPYGLIDPEACARDPAGTAVVNVVSVIQVLKDVIDAGLTPIFFSSDYVFDGTHGLWREQDEPRPRTAYGAQKLAVEAWLGTIAHPWLIARFSKIVSADTDANSVLGPWAEAIKAGAPQVLAADQVFSPTWVDDACGALIGLADTGATGLFHVANPQPLSRLALFELLLGAVQAIDPNRSVAITKARLHDLEFYSEKRPLNTSLAVEKLQTLAPWSFRSMQLVCAETAQRQFGERTLA